MGSPGQELLQGAGAPTSLLAAGSLAQRQGGTRSSGKTERAAGGPLLWGGDLPFQTRPAESPRTAGHRAQQTCTEQAQPRRGAPTFPPKTSCSVQPADTERCLCSAEKPAGGGRAHGPGGKGEGPTLKRTRPPAPRRRKQDEARLSEPGPSGGDLRPLPAATRAHLFQASRSLCCPLSLYPLDL